MYVGKLITDIYAVPEELELCTSVRHSADPKLDYMKTLAKPVFQQQKFQVFVAATVFAQRDLR